MKILLIFTLMITWGHCLAKDSYKIDFELTPEQILLDKILNPVWNDIEYTHIIADKRFIRILGDTVTFQMTEGTVVLGKKPEPLFNFSIVGNNQVKFDWKLSKLTADIKAKLRFKFKKYGINVTHDEYFIVKANEVSSSHTKLDINYKQNFKFKILHNSGFEFKHISIKPQNGVGSALRYIFDNVFSKERVDRFITEQINKELQKWINKKELVQEVETAVNKQVNELRNTVIRVSDLANHLKIDINKFDFSEGHFNLGINPSFDYTELAVHPCAQMMHRPYNKDNVTISHNLVEQMIINYATYEIWDEDRLLEPLLCFGYREYAQNGDPLGEEAEFNFLGRQIKFKYWVAPSTSPRFSYVPEEKLIKLDLNLILKLKSSHYPYLKADGDQLRAKLSAYYNLEFVPGEGLNLVFNKFDITSITGRVRVKWNRYTPYVRVPLSTVMAQVEKTINDQANDNFRVTNLVTDEIDFLGDIKLYIDEYQMLEDAHKILFRAR